MVLLNVPFQDKETVKALGARWNGAERKWFVPDGKSTEPFQRWLPRQHSEPTSPAQSLDGVGLFAFMQDIAKRCSVVMPPLSWVRAELADIKEGGKGWASLDLVEHGESGERLVTQKAMIWGGEWQAIKKKLATAGVRFEKGIKILISLRADFRANYGFQLTGYDIDPAFTLGEAEAKLQSIRDRLIKEGLYGRQKDFVMPTEFLRVAVISPVKAAGLGDFESQAKIYEQFGLCEFTYFGAIFQGPETAASLCQALDEVHRAVARAARFDAVVIIRGGGASSDLAFLNEYEIASSIARLSLPVFTGIGHEKDRTILDEVAYYSHNTPSMVINWIAASIQGNAKQAANDMVSILKDVKTVLRSARTTADGLVREIQASAHNQTLRASAEIRSLACTIEQNAHQALARSEQEIKSLMQEVVGLSPEKTLKRGFAITRSTNGSVLASAKEASTHRHIEVQFRDGVIQLQQQGGTQ